MFQLAHFIFSAFSDESGAKDIRGQIAACKANGIAEMELRGFGNGVSINNMTVEQAKEIKQIIDEEGMKVASIGSGYGKINIKDDFAPHFEAFKNTVEVAKILEARYMRIFSFFFEGVENYDEYKEEVFKRVKAMVDYADENGVLCCHENEKGIYGDTAERCLEVLEACGGKLKAVFDPANFIQCGVDTLKAFELLEDHIEYMHVKDAVYADGQVVPAGEGEGHVDEIINRLAHKKAIYVLSLEPHLKVFEGLDSLENDDETKKGMAKHTYPSHEASFKAAADAMHKLVEKAQPIRLGIIGCGNMGSGHLENHLKGKLYETRVTAVADINPERLEWAKQQAPWVKTYDTADELFNSGEVDAVVIATPHYFHPPYVIEALNHGLHVVSEKPAGVYSKQVREMNAVAEKSDKTFAIMFNQRTNCVFRKVKEIVESGKYGELHRVNWIITDWFRTQAYYNSGGWRATWSGEGGGVLLNQCPHQLDLWQWICGMPSRIHAFLKEGNWHDIEVEDDVTIYAEYPNGATGVFITTTGDYPGTNRLEITLDKAKIIVDKAEKITLIELNNSIVDSIKGDNKGFAKIQSQEVPVETDGLNEQHCGVLNAFASHILHGTPLVADGRDGINGVLLSNAAHFSSWTGKTIELPFDEEEYYQLLMEHVKNSRAKTNVVEQIQEDMSSTF